MHFGLTDEQQMIVDTVRSFVENEIYPHEELVERTGEVPGEIAQDIKQKMDEHFTKLYKSNDYNFAFYAPEEDIMVIG